MELPSPKNHAERVAIFRHSVIGPLLVREFAHGELRAELERLSEQTWRRPGADNTCTLSIPTLERWLYACKAKGLSALVPKHREDKGHGRCFEPEMCELLCDIRRENPSASVPLILQTLIDEGRLDKGAGRHEPVVRKLFAERGLPRCSARVANAEGKRGPNARKRWQKETAGALWQGDVCHFTLQTCGEKKPVRIHGLLDDASRYFVALEARSTEKEADMLVVFVDAIRIHGPPGALYLDNGATYRGEDLATICQRLGVVLLHPKPYDPEARGKIERVWRTLRERLLDFCKGEMTLAELNERLQAFRKRYHDTPHSGLLGRSPNSVYRAHVRSDGLTEAKLREAFTVRENRRVSHDNVVSVDGKEWELGQGFLAGKRVTLVRCWLEPGAPPCVELEGKRLPLHLVDRVKNGSAERAPRGEPLKLSGRGALDPGAALLRAAKKGEGT